MENQLNADKMVVLSIAIKTVYRNLLNDAELSKAKEGEKVVNKRGGILNHLEGIMAKPIIKLKEMHDNFIKGVGNDSDLFDRWVSIQLQVITLLGPDIAALSQLTNSIEAITISCGVGEQFDVREKDLFKNTSFAILTGFRVYLDDISQEDLVAGNFPLLTRESVDE